MDITLSTSIKSELNNLYTVKRIQKKRIKELTSCAGTRLIPCKKGSLTYYYGKDAGNENRVYLGNDSNKTVQNIKEQRYLSKSLAYIENNIRLLESAMVGFTEYDYDSVNVNLSPVYRNAKTEAAASYKRDVQSWKTQQNRVKEEYLLLNPERHPESLRIQRANGELMRSRAEVMIADTLDSYGIPYVYEVPHLCNGIWMKTDFTILSVRDYKTELLLEHVGLMSDSDYRTTFTNKLHNYMMEGYIPNINLFFSFDNIDGSLSLVPIQNIINTWLI